MSFFQLEVSLDLYIAYLRSAFHTCYYCALVTDYVEELQRKCIKHVRRPLPTPVTAEGKTAEVKAEDGAEPDESAKDVTEENEAEKRLREKELREKNKAGSFTILLGEATLLTNSCRRPMVRMAGF